MSKYTYLSAQCVSLSLPWLLLLPLQQVHYPDKCFAIENKEAKLIHPALTVTSPSKNDDVNLSKSPKIEWDSVRYVPP